MALAAPEREGSLTFYMKVLGKTVEHLGHLMYKKRDAAIAELPEPYRPVLRLRLRYGHHPSEIAHALDRPAATVRSQLARGLSLLRRKLPSGFVAAHA